MKSSNKSSSEVAIIAAFKIACSRRLSVTRSRAWPATTRRISTRRTGSLVARTRSTSRKISRSKPSVAFTRFRSSITDSYERRYPQVQIDERTDKPGSLYFGHLVWSFAYGKFRWFGDSTNRFDFNASIGAGVTDDTTSQGITGSFGLGTKLYFAKWFGVRADVRDHILRETFVGEDHLVNDIVVTLGPSIFVPWW